MYIIQSSNHLAVNFDEINRSASSREKKTLKNINYIKELELHIIQLKGKSN